MAKVVVLGWEFGANLGHITTMLRYAHAFEARGWRAVFVLRDTSQAQKLLSPHGFSWFQAPVAVTHTKGLDGMLNYADVLLQNGYADADSLSGLVQAWVELFQLVKPSLILADSSPTLNLVGKVLSLSVYQIGNGFSVPPAQSPWPIFIGQEVRAKAQPQRAIQLEQFVLRNINTVLNQKKIKPLNQLYELYPPECALVYSSQLLDDYERGKHPVRYVEPMVNAVGAAPARWPLVLGPADQGVPAPKVFVYLRADHAGTVDTLKALEALKTQVLAYVPDLSDAQIVQLNSASLQISRQMFDVASVFEDCALVVCHGGGLCDTALRAGIPLYLLPTFSEQTGRADKIAKLGCGLWSPNAKGIQHKQLLKRILTDSQFRERTKNLSVKYGQRDSAQLTLDQAVDWMCQQMPVE